MMGELSLKGVCDKAGFAGRGGGPDPSSPGFRDLIVVEIDP